MPLQKDKFGYIIITDPEKAGAEEHDCYLCCHCQRMVVVQPGSGKLRTWCHMCNAGTCGGLGCIKNCIPFEAKLEAMEGTRKFWKNVKLEGKKF